jgi:hypothetical protein
MASIVGVGRKAGVGHVGREAGIGHVGRVAGVEHVVDVEHVGGQVPCVYCARVPCIYRARMPAHGRCVAGVGRVAHVAGVGGLCASLWGGR